MGSDKTYQPGTRRPRAAAKNNRTRVTGRPLATRVKTAKGRKSSSTRWLKRQLNDPYVIEAQRLGFRSRAAFKLAELDDRFQFLKVGKRVVDLGAAPGGWTQVAVERTNALGNVTNQKQGRVIGLDLLGIDAIAGADLLQGDFMRSEDTARLLSLLAGPADIVLTDMAASATGHKTTDHLHIMGLLEATVDFADQILAPGGTFVGKVLRGGTENQLLINLKHYFRKVRHAKPPASRDDSSEYYVVAQDFRSGGSTKISTQ